MIRTAIVGVACAASVWTFAAAPSAAATFTRFSIPGVVRNPGTPAINVSTIDAQGNVYGWYTDRKNVQRGFVRKADGSVTSFVPAGAVNIVLGRGDQEGNVGGTYLGQDGKFHGFLRHSDGNIETFGDNVLVYATKADVGTVGSAQGQVGGQVAVLGFFRNPNGQLKTFSVKHSNSTMATGIGSAIVGYFHSPGRSEPGKKPIPAGMNGFIRNLDKSIMTFRIHDADNTYVTGTNDSGSVVGYFQYAPTQPGQTYAGPGYIRAADGSVTVVKPRRSINTMLIAINASGATIGNYTDADNVLHQFVRSADGTIELIKFHGGTNVSARAINDDGVIAGTYYDANNVIHGFIREP